MLFKSETGSYTNHFIPNCLKLNTNLQSFGSVKDFSSHQECTAF